MSEHSAKHRTTINQLIIWCIAAPILSIWSLVSLLPVVSVINAWGNVVDVFIALGFLASGAVGLVACAIVYRLLLWEKTRVAVTTYESRTLRAMALSAYALVWMALYAV